MDHLANAPKRTVCAHLLNNCGAKQFFVGRGHLWWEKVKTGRSNSNADSIPWGPLRHLHW